jgi:hypothetical protein
MPEMIRVEEQSQANPLDILENMFSANDWPYERRGRDEIGVVVSGRWCDYSLVFSWCDEISALHYCCAMDMRVPDASRAQVSELLAIANEKMWVGHFGVCNNDSVPLYRHTVLLRGTRGVSAESLEDMVDISLTECERFYPAFQFVIWGGKTASEAVAAAMLECVGEA